MKSFASRLYGSGAAVQSLKIAEQSVPLHYAFLSFRWHQDIRPPMKIIAVHDLLGCSATWEQTFNTSMAALPLTNNTPRDPLEIYSVELRGHNHSEAALTTLNPETYASACVADVVRVRQDVLGGDASLVGIGFGAMVSAAAMLHAPGDFSNAVLFANTISDLYRFDPNHCPVRQSIADNTEATSFCNLSESLKKTVTSDVDRALILAMADQLPTKTRLRIHKDLLSVNTPLTIPGIQEAVCNAPVTLYLPADAAPTAEESKLFARNFPRGFIQRLEKEHGSILAASDPSRSERVLYSLNVLEELQTE